MQLHFFLNPIFPMSPSSCRVQIHLFRRIHGIRVGKISSFLFGSLDYYYYISVLLNLILLVMDMEFEFSIDNDGEIEEVSPWDESSVTDCETVMSRILRNNKIGLGERSEGKCDIVNDVVTLVYRVCLSVGGDWDQDDWSDETDTFPLSDI